jgi:zeta-carotene isomerase
VWGRFDTVKERTSVVPFLAVLEGRQKLPGNYASELLRAPYVIVTAFTLGAYALHPFFQSASYQLHW